MIPFLLSPIGRYLIIAVVALGAIGGEYLYLRVHYYNSGYAAALHAVAAKDQRAIDAANKAREAVKACRDSGRQWNVANGMCG